MTRLQKIDKALEEGRRLTFEYMRLGDGRKSIERRLVNPLNVSTTREGRQVLSAEDHGREGAPRSFRVERMFHVNLV